MLERCPIQREGKNYLGEGVGEKINGQVVEFAGGWKKKEGEKEVFFWAEKGELIDGYLNSLMISIGEQIVFVDNQI